MNNQNNVVAISANVEGWRLGGPERYFPDPAERRQPGYLLAINYNTIDTSFNGFSGVSRSTISGSRTTKPISCISYAGAR
jgi:hypothetical protein